MERAAENHRAAGYGTRNRDAKPPEGFVYDELESPCMDGNPDRFVVCI